jgi:hypothetical protein
MSHPLDGCRLKLARAYRHLEEFKAAAAPITARPPERLPGEYDPSHSQYIFKAPRDMYAPLELSAIVGDVVHNLFAALDYLAWELTPIAERVEPQARSIGFPIYRDQGRYGNAIRFKIPGIDQAVETLIRRVQPFSVSWRDGHPSKHPLARLQDLELQDKHRTLHILDVEAKGELVGGDPAIRRSAGPTHFLRGSYRQGQLLATLGTFSTDDQPDIALRISHGVTFGEGPVSVEGFGVVEILEEIERYVRGTVVPSLQRFV